MKEKYIRPFLKDLPKLQAGGIVDEATARRLQEYYQSSAPASARNWGLIVFGILGALLIGFGCMLLFGHNWEDLSRPARTMLSFAPIVVMLALAGWGMWTDKTSTAWREGIGTLWVLAVGASIGLISQTYHISGDFWDFILTWVVLALPVMYLLNAVTPALMCLAGIYFWTTKTFWMLRNPWYFWALIAAVLPYAVWQIRCAPNGMRSKLLQLGVAAILCARLGFAMGHSVPGLWILAYAGFFACLYLYGAIWFDESPSPFRGMGEIGGMIFALVLAFPFPWEDVGWRYAEYAKSSSAIWLVRMDYVLAFGLPALAVVLLLKALRAGKKNALYIGLLPVLAAVGFAWAAGNGKDVDLLLPPMLFSIYPFVVGILQIREGVGKMKIRNVVLGFCLVLAIINIRFFDGDWSMVARGIVFIVLGVAFLTTNVWILKRRKAVAP